MKHRQIHRINSAVTGQCLGCYVAATPGEALDMMAFAAGYRSCADMCEIASEGEITVTVIRMTEQ